MSLSELFTTLPTETIEMATEMPAEAVTATTSNLIVFPPYPLAFMLLTAIFYLAGYIVYRVFPDTTRLTVVVAEIYKKGKVKFVIPSAILSAATVLIIFIIGKIIGWILIIAILAYGVWDQWGPVKQKPIPPNLDDIRARLFAVIEDLPPKYSIWFRAKSAGSVSIVKTGNETYQAEVVISADPTSDEKLSDGKIKDIFQILIDCQHLESYNNCVPSVPLAITSIVSTGKIWRISVIIDKEDNACTRLKSTDTSISDIRFGYYD
ncbi:hypothetical protein FACS189490_04790 [Clostridia bacterium]|nr:hypothetical protein FACS189490_04790 [Clostridia bacterium]